MRNDDNNVFRSIGLCSTCDNLALCGHRARRRFDAQQCELFDSSGGPGMLVTETGTARMTSVNYDGARMSDENAAPRGLCLNCEICDTCMLPRPAEGVWHCEEYQ